MKKINPLNKLYFFLFVLISLTMISGCGSMRTQVDHYDDILKNVDAGQYSQAVKEIKKAKVDGNYEAKD